jgi:GNAT superfamily N-acetyltransferase
MQILYREYDTTDTTPITYLMSELGYSVNEEELKFNIQEIQNMGGTVFVAEFNGRVIGCICTLIDARLAEGVYGELVSLIVAEKFRGTGVGKGLVEVGEQWIGKRATRIRVRANEIRSDTHAFYKYLGYRESKTQKIFIKNV